jgi:hypothetical protein
LHLPSPQALLYIVLIISTVLIALVVARPTITASREGKMLAFVAFLILPAVCAIWGGIRPHRTFEANPILPQLPHHGTLWQEPGRG